MIKHSEFLLSVTPTGATAEFINNVAAAESIRGDALRVPIRDVVNACNVALSKILELRQQYDEMQMTEENEELMGLLGEYEQKLGAMEREINKVRTAASAVAVVVRDFERLEQRTGDPLRAEPDGA